MIHTIKCYKLIVRIIILIVVYDVNIYTNCIDTQRDGFDKDSYLPYTYSLVLIPKSIVVTMCTTWFNIRK